MKSLNATPRNLQQLKNYRRSGKSKDSNVLYSVMLRCKLCEGKEDSFVRDVKAAPNPKCVLFTDWQLSECERFTTDPRERSIITVDTTYNLGNFYVTPIVHEHYMLEDTKTGKHPSFVGLHQRKNFSAFNYFAGTLIGHCKKLRNVCTFGTDRDDDAFSQNFPNASHPKSEADEFIADIFGKHLQ